MTTKTVFGNTILMGINKAGELKPDESGYYTVVLGALDVPNSGGEEYVLTDVSRNTFTEGSKLDQRCSEGLLKGEWGHPKTDDYPNLMLFERRVRMIHEDRISHNIRKVYLKEIEYQGRKVLGIIGEVRPCGPYGPALKDMLDDPHQNVCFSGRYYSNVRRGPNGVIQREIHTVGTWDFVSEPGVAQAKKYYSPSLESADDVTFSYDMLLESFKREQEGGSLESMSMESCILSVADIMPTEMLTKARHQTQPKTAFFGW